MINAMRRADNPAVPFDNSTPAARYCTKCSQLGFTQARMRCDGNRAGCSECMGHVPQPLACGYLEDSTQVPLHVLEGEHAALRAVHGYPSNTD